MILCVCKHKLMLDLLCDELPVHTTGWVVVVCVSIVCWRELALCVCIVVYGLMVGYCLFVCRLRVPFRVLCHCVCISWL